MLRSAILLLFSFHTLVSLAEPQWSFDEHFSSSEKQHLQEWVRHAETGIQNLFGALPYQYRVHFQHSKKGRGPVPWAHTDKRRGREVYFHVNTNYAWDLFRRDWTAPHELSHLMFPYLGKGGKWFSEGLASYLQYQIMYANGTISWRQAVNKLRERFQATSRQRVHKNTSVENMSYLAADRTGYNHLYWGGAAYFMRVDKALSEQKSIRLNNVIASYLECCIFRNIHTSADMITLFDKISDSDIFISSYKETIITNNFPDTSESMSWLRTHPPEIKTAP